MKLDLFHGATVTIYPAYATLPELMLPLLVIVLLSYLLGSVPSAYLIARGRGVDIFSVGSGNMGATNVARVMGLQWGLLVWSLDSLKGITAILIARGLLPEHNALATVTAALVAIIGHNWSLFAGLLTGSLRGGKGAATAFGTLLLIVPGQVFLVTLALSGAVVALTRYMSLGVLVMFALITGWTSILIVQQQYEPIFGLYLLLMSALIVYRFRGNIQRLLAGTERRLGEAPTHPDPAVPPRSPERAA